MAKMSTNELLKQVYRKATGELDDSVEYDTEDGQTVLSVVNEQVDVYYNSVDQYGARIIWQRNIDPEYVIGTADGTTTLFDIDWDEVQSLPDGFYYPIRVREGDEGEGIRYDLVPYSQLFDGRHQNPNRCAICAEGLQFFSAPPAGDILFPCVVQGQKLKGPETDVESVTGVHNLLWLMQAAAAEYVRTDIVRGEQFTNVLTASNETFRRMLEDNEARTQPLIWDYDQKDPSSSSVSYDW